MRQMALLNKYLKALVVYSCYGGNCKRDHNSNNRERKVSSFNEHVDKKDNLYWSMLLFSHFELF